MGLKMDMIVRLGWIALAMAAAYAYVRYFEWKNFYYPTRALSSTPADFGLDYEDVQFVAEDGALLHGWWIPCKDARGTMIYCHGNAGNIGDRAWMMADLHRLDVNLFIFDYRGYGKSKGIPTEQGTYRDARAAYEVVRARYADSEKPPVIVYGHSLGGAIAVQLAVDKPIRALIVESSFSSSIDMGRTLYPALPIRWLLHFRYDSVSKVAGLTMPKLFAHGKPDQVIPYPLGRKLFDAAAEPKHFVELPGHHGDIAWTSSGEYWQALRDLVQKALPEQ